MIKKQGGEYAVKSESGKPMGTYDTAAAARRRLAQIEYFKHRDKAKGG